MGASVAKPLVYGKVKVAAVRYITMMMNLTTSHGREVDKELGHHSEGTQ